MQLNLPPDLETLINKRRSGGAYSDEEDVLRHTLEAQDAEEGWTEEERRYPGEAKARNAMTARPYRRTITSRR